MKLKIFLTIGFLSIVAVIWCGFLLSHKPVLASELKSKVNGPIPTEGEDNEKLRELYNKLRHKTAPGIVWELVEMKNKAMVAELKKSLLLKGNNITQSFANGAISGDWTERGANNQTGSVRAIDYEPATNTIFTISNGGSLWSSVLGAGVWTLLNQDLKFDAGIIKAFTKTGGGTRELVSTNQNIYYSDNNGQSFSPSSGISFPVAWGGNYIASLIRLDDGNNTIYCVTRPWSAAPWGPRFWLYRSVNQGQNFNKIFEFTFGDDEQLSICNPYNTNDIFIADIGTTLGNLKLYTVAGANVSLLNSYAIGPDNTKCVLKGTHNAGKTVLYTMLNNNSLLMSINSGMSWSVQSTLPENAWGRMNVSPSNPAKVSFGGVNAFRSSNAGVSWIKVNDWSEYYNSIVTKLHADIMEIEYFKKLDNSEFAIINCHGGTYVSYNELTTVSNLSLSGHIAVEYYDVISDTNNFNRVFCGSQDQGLQRTLTGNLPGRQNFSQVISGDFGHLSLTGYNQFLWPQYPGGAYYLYTGLGNLSPTYLGFWQMNGTQKSNYGWMLPAKSTTNIAANEIWIGGGNINGGGGSYLAKAKMLSFFPYTVTATQFNFDFRANSRTTTAGVTAIEQSPFNSNQLYVATEDGTFFYSNDLGTTWNKTASFTGPFPWYLYGSCILASNITNNVIWYGGSGYSNPGVYKSIDGGVTFSPMSNGLPPTLVNEIAASPDEHFLFAATEAGPYVYVTVDNTWYPLIDNNTPTQFFSNVEYIRALNIVRFGTMGRGIWDFKVNFSGPVIYTFFGDGDWNLASNWSNNAIPPSVLPTGSEIIISPLNTGKCILNIQQTISSGSKISVSNSKKFLITGNLNIVKQY